MKNKTWLAFIPLALATLFCTFSPSVPTELVNSLETSVSATLTALVPTPTDTLPPDPVVVLPETGFIAGHLSYPSEFIPPLRVVAWSAADMSYYFIDTDTNTFEYTIELPPGTYYMVAYVRSGDSVPIGFAGGYTQAVPCGLAYGCDDHTLIPVVVEAGVTVYGIDPGDWYADPAAFPPMP